MLIHTIICIQYHDNHVEFYTIILRAKINTAQHYTQTHTDTDTHRQTDRQRGITLISLATWMYFFINCIDKTLSLQTENE